MVEIGSPAPQNRINAAPPKVTNTGTPIIVASKSPANAGITMEEGAAGGYTPSQTAMITGNAVTARPIHVGEECCRSRRAIKAKPAGIATSIHHTGTP